MWANAIYFTHDCPDFIVDEKKDSQEELRIIEALSKTKTDVTKAQFSVSKENFKFEMLQIIDSLTNSQELDFSKNMLAPLQPTLSAFRNSKTKLYEKLYHKVPHNKNKKTTSKGDFTRPRKQHQREKFFSWRYQIVEKQMKLLSIYQLSIDP